MSEREAWQVTDDAAVIYEQSFVPAIFAWSAIALADAAGIGTATGCSTSAAAPESSPGKPRSGSEQTAAWSGSISTRACSRWHGGSRPGSNGDRAMRCSALRDGAFDVVVSQFAMMFFPDPARSLGEMWRVLAARGRLAVAVCGRLADAAGYAALARVAERVCTPEVVDLLRSPFALGDPEQLAGLARAAGIEGAEVELGLSGALPIDRRSRADGGASASPIRDVIDDRSFDALLQGARAALAPFCRNGGEVAFALPVHTLTATRP